MQYKSSELSMAEAMDRMCDYEYALLYMMSELIFQRTSELPQIDWQECLEARFFSGDRELHIFSEGGEHIAVEIEDAEIEDAEIEDVVIKKYELAGKFHELGKVLCVQEYLTYDEDGQAYVELTRLTGVE